MGSLSILLMVVYFKVKSCLVSRVQFSGHQVKILNLKHDIKRHQWKKNLMYNCCFEICKQ